MKVFILLVFILIGCTQLKYKSDIGFLNSAQANSPEFPLKINGKTCKDSEGKIGLCSFRIKSDEDLRINLLSWPEDRKINFTCSDNIDFNKSFHVPKKKDFTASITSLDFSDDLSFTCIVKIFRANDEQKISYMAKFHITIVDSKYQGREEIYRLNDHLIIGQHSYYTIINGKAYRHKTSHRIKKENDVLKVLSVSEMGRINSYGF